MKSMKHFVIMLAVVCLAAVLVFCIMFSVLTNRNINANNVAVNRINSELTQAFEDGVELTDYIAERYKGWEKLYGRSCPDDIEYISMHNDGDTFYSHTEKGTVLCTIYKDGELCGFVRYIYDDDKDMLYVFSGVGIIIFSFVLSACFALYVHINIIKPFQALSEYPERMARLQTKQKIPESKNRYFGKYIWGMNMLSDQLEQNRKHIAKLEYQRQTLLASIAHGVKTPVANIRLYAEAIMMGLYSDSANESVSSDIAQKIDNNAKKIETLVGEMLETAVTSLMDYEPEIEHFYLKELGELVRKEFSDRLDIMRIPYTIECDEGYMASSDKWALFRVISQLLENAMKYGSGEGMTVSLAPQDEGFCISVKNKGELLPEKEMPYIFKSYWRGSNAENKEGSGIGLYVASETVKRLGGSIHARRLESTSEMEFVIYIE